MDVEILIRRFRQNYGNVDLKDKWYLDEEYTYKHDRGRQMREWLAKDVLTDLIEQNKCAEICQRVVRSFTMQGPLARWNEYQWVRDLNEDESRTFSLALLPFLYGEAPFADRLTQFVKAATTALRGLRARDQQAAGRYSRSTLSWPFVSYFHFLMWPDQLSYVFLKPAPLTEAARVAGFDLAYRSTPNATTYASTQAFYEALWPRVQEMGGRDWIDVQTLIHVAGGGFGIPEGGWVDKRDADRDGWRQKLADWLRTNPRTMPAEVAELRRAFVERFPKERLDAMTLREYALGHEGTKDSFCYWLEWKTEQLGSVKGGSVSKFGVWWSQKEGVWRWNAALRADTAEAAWAKIRTGLVRMVQAAEAHDLERLDEIGAQVLGPSRYSLRAKPLWLYYPDTFLPISNPDHLASFLAVFGLTPEGDLHARNLQLLDYLRDQDEFEGFDTLQMMGFLYDTYPPQDFGSEPDDQIEEIPIGKLEPPSLKMIQAHVAASHLVFSPESIANYHLSLLTKPFVILTGLSGTGKTALTRLYADAAHGIGPGELNPFYRLIAVRPDWNDHRGLLGYYNPLTETYDATPFLRFLLQAATDPGHWYYVCLDEMNLARVEYYYSDFLSALESGDRLRFHPFEGECVATRSGQGIDARVPLAEAAASRDYEVSGVLYIPDSILIPPNLLVTGTVNVDETTHAFSDKVLDRANSIELNHADMETYLQRYERDHSERSSVVNEASPLLLEAYAILEPYYLHFGYRTLKEILDYLWNNETLPDDTRLTKTEARDNQLMQKVLPKLRGDERIEPALEQLWEAISRELGSECHSARKVSWMLSELRTYGSTHFWR